MPNPYYNHDTGVPQALTRGASDLIRNEFDRVEEGVAKVPAPEKLATNSVGYVEDTGGVNAFFLTGVPSVVSLAAGMEFKFKAAYANTGAATLDVNGIGAKAVRRMNGDALQAGDIFAGQIVTLTYSDATDAFQYFSSGASASASAAASAAAALASAGEASGSAGDAAVSAAAAAGSQSAASTSAGLASGHASAASASAAAAAASAAAAEYLAISTSASAGIALATGQMVRGTNGSVITYTFPASPTSGQRVGTWPKNGREDNVVNLNGKRCRSNTDPTVTLDIADQAVMWVFIDNTYGWDFYFL